MFGKILLTTLIVLAAVMFLRKHRQDERLRLSASSTGSTKAPDDTENPAPAKPALNDYRFAAYLFLALMIGSGAYLYYLRWQDDSTLITVILHRDGNATPVTYQVYKHQLEDRGFTTIDGVRVTVAASERMEVIGL